MDPSGDRVHVLGVPLSVAGEGLLSPSMRVMLLADIGAASTLAVFRFETHDATKRAP